MAEGRPKPAAWKGENARSKQYSSVEETGVRICSNKISDISRTGTGLAGASGPRWAGQGAIFADYSSRPKPSNLP